MSSDRVIISLILTVIAWGALRLTIPHQDNQGKFWRAFVLGIYNLGAALIISKWLFENPDPAMIDAAYLSGFLVHSFLFMRNAKKSILFSKLWQQESKPSQLPPKDNQSQ